MAYVLHTPKESVTTFPDDKTLTIRFKPGASVGDLRSDVQLRYERLERYKRRIKRIESVFAKSENEEEQARLFKELREWEAALSEFEKSFDEFRLETIMQLGEGWDVTKAETGEPKPFTLEALKEVHPTRRELVFMNIMQAFGILKEAAL
jgi:hypothetical protein